VNRRALLRRLSRGALNNVSFAEVMNLAQGFGFQLSRVSGSHHILTHPDIAELLNLQDVRGKPNLIRSGRS